MRIVFWLPAARRALRMSPFQAVLSRLRKNGVDVRSLDALEVFGYSGEFHTMDYASEVHSLEVWEIDEQCRILLKRNLPKAEIKITDSFEEAKQTDHTFSFIVVDNPVWMFDGHCEHFDILPLLFRLMREECIVVLNLVLNVTEADKRRYPHLLNHDQVKRRQEFYGLKDVNPISLDDAVALYLRLIEDAGFSPIWWFVVSRRSFVQYFTVKVRRHSTV